MYRQMRVKLYATLRDLLGCKEIDVEACEGETMRHVLRRLSAAYPALGQKLWDGDENLSGLVTVLLNGRMLAFVGGLDAPVHPTDDVKLFPPVGGG
jgi:sulfur-carrier protein